MIEVNFDFYIVATPIGNYKDITLRALEVLQKVDFIVCEKEKEYKKLFGIVNVPVKDFVICDRKREKEAIEIVMDLLGSGKKGALISDCGTPLFEDPGFLLVERIRKQYSLTALPGANSLITALSLAPFKITDFYFAGFLPREKEKREKMLSRLLNRKEALAFFETPYRLQSLLESLRKHTAKRQIFIPYNLTMKDEMLFSGTAGKVEALMKQKNITKGEFLVVIEGKL